MQNEIKKIFVSSTYKDLKDYRLKVKQAVEELGYVFLGMELWGARNEEPTKVAYNEIQQCDIFVGIYAHYYGSIPKNETKSITELEYCYAQESNKPCLCFRIDRNFPWSEKFKDKGKLKKQLGDFLDKIDREVVRTSFTNADNLATSVTTALSNISTHFLSYQSLREACELHVRIQEAKVGSKLQPFEIPTQRIDDIGWLYVNRKKIEGEFEEFIRCQKSEKEKIFLVVDIAGSGKTNLVFFLAEYYGKRQPVFVFLSGEDLGTKSFENYFLEQVMRQNPAFRFFQNFQELCRLLKDGDHEILIFLDAINEANSSRLFIDKIRELISHCKDLPILFLITCRELYWRDFKAYEDFWRAHLWRREVFFRLLSNFEKDEFETASKIYFQQYGIEGKINGEAKKDLSHPLLLRIFCEAYQPIDNTFKITKQSLKNLKSESVPPAILEKLESIESQKIKGEEKFLSILKAKLGNEQTVRYKLLILQYAKDIEYIGTIDSIQRKKLFDKYLERKAQSIAALLPTSLTPSLEKINLQLRVSLKRFSWFILKTRKKQISKYEWKAIWHDEVHWPPKIFSKIFFNRTTTTSKYAFSYSHEDFLRFILDEHILLETSEDETTIPIQFTYEECMEYMIALTFWEGIDSHLTSFEKIDMKKKSKQFRKFVSEHRDFPNIFGVLLQLDFICEKNIQIWETLIEIDAKY